MKPVLVLILCLAAATPLLAQKPFQCPRNTEDMLTYFVMAYPDRVDHFLGPGNANPIYTALDPEIGAGYASQGTFLWIKSSNGYPWDVNTFDRYYIYQRSTELTWTDPTTFKRMTNDMPIAPRCVSTRSGGSPIAISPSRSSYSFYSNCQSTGTANLNYVVNTISAPATMTAGGNLGNVKTRLLTYQYACDSHYSKCGYKEVYSLGQNVGLYDWKYYKSQNGKWVFVQESAINTFAPGQTTAFFACPNTYQ